MAGEKEAFIKLLESDIQAWELWHPILRAST